MRILALILFFSSQAFAEPAILSFGESVTPDVTYNVYQNDEIIYSGSDALEYDVNKNDGDVFFITAVNSSDIESSASVSAVVPYRPENLNLIRSITVKTIVTFD